MSEKRPPFREAVNERFYGRKIRPPQICQEKCGDCGQCVRICPVRVFGIRAGKTEVVNGGACIGCRHCWAACPDDAIVLDHPPCRTAFWISSEAAVAPGALIRLLAERRSVRLFSQEPVSKSQLQWILDAASCAPTSCNTQNVQYVVLSTREKVDQLRVLVDAFYARIFKVLDHKLIAALYGLRYGRGAVDMLRCYSSLLRQPQEKQGAGSYVFLPYGAAVIVAHSRCSDGMESFNCSAALNNGALMAHTLKLGACFLGFVHTAVNRDKRIKRWLAIPREHECHGAMVLGSPAVKYRRLVEKQPSQIHWI